MDLFSLTVGGLTIVDLAAKSASIIYDYCSNVKNAKSDIMRLRQELNNLESVLQEATNLFDGTIPDENLKNTINECRKVLSELLDKLTPRKVSKFAAKFRLRELKWPFEAKDVIQISHRITTYRDTVNLAINVKQR